MGTSRISVVVASTCGGEPLFRCLDSLRTQSARHGSPVIVVDRTGSATRDRIRREHPRVVVIDADARPGVARHVPALRATGLLHATTEIVAILQEHCVAPDGWLDAITDAMQPGVVAVGGPITHDSYRRTRDWAVYFAEYNGCMPPWQAGDRAALATSNAAYCRSVVARHSDVISRGFWEPLLHPRLRSEGALRAAPGMTVRKQGPFGYLHYAHQRWLLSRAWGGTCRSDVGELQRVAHVALSPILPLVLALRCVRNARRGGVGAGRLAMTMPLMIPLWLVYAAGEAAGYALGPGDAMERVE